MAAPEPRRVVLAALASLAVASAAHAQPRPAPGSPLPGLQSPPAPAVTPALPPPNVAPAAVAPGQIFAITQATIDDATAYSAAELAPYLADLTGPAVKLEKIEAARAALVSRYRRDGYTYTSVRARISQTQLHLVVIEPHVVAVKLSQDIGPAGTQVLRFLDHLADGRLLRQSDLERWVLLANDVPGVSVHLVLDPSGTDPGAITVRAVVQRQAESGVLRADNRAFQLTGPEELLAVADLNSFTSLGERTELSMYHTFNNTDNFGQASEEFFIGGSGLKLKIYGGAGESLPSGTLRALGYDGVTRVFGAALSYPVIRSRQHNLSLAAQFDGVESDISYNVLGANSAPRCHRYARRHLALAKISRQHSIGTHREPGFADIRRLIER
jgi:hemolysin activation/secretion protein